MARTALVAAVAPGGYAAGGVDTGEVAADATNFNSITATGRDLILARNSDTVAHTVTIHSVVDAYGRTGDIAQSIPAGKTYAFGPFPTGGWKQSDNTLHVDADNALVFLATITMPS